MRRSLQWIGSGLALAGMAALGIFLFTGQASAKPRCNCPNIVQTPHGPCYLVSCSGFDCVYQCPFPG
jgi:hypothetical protein